MESSDPVKPILELLEQICSTTSFGQLKILACEYMERYQKRDETNQADKELAFSDFFFECEAYYPDDDSIWHTEYADICINSAQLRDAAKCTLQKVAE